MKWLWRFHDWYDTLTEPRRLLLLLVLVAPAITAGLWADTAVDAAILLLWVAVVLAPRVYRHHNPGKCK